MTPPAPHRFRTRARTKAMAEESDARIERLEKDSQESRAQIVEMMELIKTLIKDKGQASSPGPQNETVQPDQRKEEPIYPIGFTLPYAPNIHMAQAPPLQQARGFSYGYAPPPTRVNEVEQNSGANTADPITILDLDDPKKKRKSERNHRNNLKIMRLNGSLSSSKNA